MQDKKDVKAEVSNFSRDAVEKDKDVWSDFLSSQYNLLPAKPDSLSELNFYLVLLLCSAHVSPGIVLLTSSVSTFLKQTPTNISRIETEETLNL